MKVKCGDIFRMGKHRLMCSNATCENDVIKLINNEKINLVLTDPPYGMKVQYKNYAKRIE